MGTFKVTMTIQGTKEFSAGSEDEAFEKATSSIEESIALKDWDLEYSELYDMADISSTEEDEKADIKKAERQNEFPDGDGNHENYREK